MIIRCPHCAFSRTVDDNRIPAAAQTATCPKCHHKFRFRGDEAPVEGHAAAEGHTRAPATEPFAESASESAPGQSSASAGTYGDAPAGFGGAGQEAPGQGVFTQDGSASESGEDIWDRVASLGESWADDADFDQIGEAGASGKDAPWSERRALGAYPELGPVEGLWANGVPRRFATPPLLQRPGRAAFPGLGPGFLYNGHHPANLFVPSLDATFPCQRAGAWPSVRLRPVRQYPAVVRHVGRAFCLGVFSAACFQRKRGGGAPAGRRTGLPGRGHARAGLQCLSHAFRCGSFCRHNSGPGLGPGSLYAGLQARLPFKPPYRPGGYPACLPLPGSA